MLATLPLTDAHAHAAKLEAEAQRECFRPREELSILDHAHANRRMSKETGHEGPWSVERVPYLRAPLEALSDYRVREVTIVKPAQSGASEGVVLNTVFYYVDHEPSPILVAYPTEGEAEKFSKKKLAPAIRDTPCVAGKIADSKSRKGDSTILEKTFHGGSLGIVGGASARNFRMVSARVLVADDVDGLDPAVSEGDQIVLMRQRANAFDDYKGLWVSSPGDGKNTKIFPLYRSMERRGRFHVPCPHCERMQVLRFGGPKERFGLKWEREERNGETVHFPETAAFLCEHCGALIDERHKYAMVQAGEYLSDTDGSPLLSVPARTYGFWYTAFVSYFANVSWGNIARSFLDATREKNHEQLRVIKNTIFAETFEMPEEGEAVDAAVLEGRASLYVNAQGERIEVPNGVGTLTAFADVQRERIEVLVVGWGESERTWLIAHHRIPGDTSQPDAYRMVDGIRARVYRHELGAEMRVVAFGIDSGDGVRTSEVYDYVAAHRGEQVYATKGHDFRQKVTAVLAKTPPKPGVRLLHIGTHPLKSLLASRLKLKAGEDGSLPHGWMHLRAAEPGWHNGADAEFYAQFSRERLRLKRMPNGKWVPEWVTKGANEAIDLYVGNMALMEFLGPAWKSQLGALAEEVAKRGAPPAESQKKEKEAEPPRASWVTEPLGERGDSWAVGGWR